MLQKYEQDQVIDGTYKVIEFLGAGSFSAVYKVRDLRRKICVLKFITTMTQKVNSLELLKKECNILDGLNYPNIAKLIDVGRLQNGTLYIKLEYIEGPTITSLLEQAEGNMPPLSLQTTQKVILDLLDALEYLHTNNVLHRDIKPSNLILNPKRGVVIIDFNVSKVILPGKPIKHPPTEVGTSGYIPPEVKFRGKPWTPASDIYSSGIVLYQMLTGNLPFEKSIVDAPPILPSEFYKEIDPAIETIVLKAIANQPDNRYQSAREMKATIEKSWPAESPAQISLNKEEIMPDNNSSLDHAPSRVRNLLINAEKDAKDGKFAVAENLIEQARKAADDFAELQAEVETAAAKVADFRQSKIEGLLRDAHKLMADRQQIDEGRIGALLDDVQDIDPGNETAARLRTELSRQAHILRERKVYDDTLAQCQRLWGREQELLKASVSTDEILEKCYHAALGEAERVAANNPDSALLRGLVNETRQKYNHARDRYEVLSTAAQAGAYRELMVVLDRIQNPDEPIRLLGPKGEDLGTKPVAEARLEVLQMSETFAYSKAVEYLGAAQQHIYAHAPRAARDALEERTKLFILDSETNTRLEKYLQDTVLPELEKLERAESLLQQAELDNDPLEGWKLAEKAVGEEGYSWAPGVADVRQALLPRLEKRAERLIAESRDALDDDRLSEARSSADGALELAEVVSHYADEFNLSEVQASSAALLQEARAAVFACQAEETLRRNLASAADDLDKLLTNSPEKAPARWNELVDGYGENNLKRFDRYRQLQKKIDKLGGVPALLARLESVFASNDAERIRLALPDCETALENPDYASLRSKLTDVQEKLQLRRDYLIALETLYEQKDAAEALKWFDRVAAKKSHPDSEAAKTQADKIRAQVEAEERVIQALDEAQSYLNASPPQPRQAYEALRPFENEITLKKKEIRELLHQARKAWEQKLVDIVRKEVRKRNPDPGRLRDWADELDTDLPEPRPVQVAAIARAKAAVSEARGHEQHLEWKQAAEKWLEAIQYDRLDAYQQAWKHARKRETELALKNAGDQEAMGLFTQLESQMPQDPEVWKLQAEFYSRRARKSASDVKAQVQYYASAHHAIREAHEVLNRSKKQDQVFSGRLSDIENKITAAEALARGKLSIEGKLVASRGRSDFVTAVQAAQNLIREHPNDTGVKDWWANTRTRVAQELETEDAKLTDEQLWERFDVRSKILILDSGHALAEKLLSTLPDQVRSLNTEINSALSDSKRGLLVTADTDMDVLEVQRQDIDELQGRAQTLYDIVNRHSQDIPGQEIDSLARGLLRENLTKLYTLLSQLDKIQQFTARAQQYLAQAQASGDWYNFNNTMNQINAAGFQEHRTIDALTKRRDSIQQRRTDLLALRERLVQAAQNEQFGAAQRLVSQFETDPHHGDPDDDFGLQGNISVPDPITGLTITDWEDLKDWLTERQNQIDTLASWLARSGAADLLPEGVPAPALPEMPRGVVSGPASEKKIKEWVDQGNFKAAIAEGQCALGGFLTNSQRTPADTSGQDSDWYDHRQRILALKPGHDRLAASSLIHTSFHSTVAKNTLSGANLRRDELVNQIKQAEERLKWAEHQRQAWYQAFPELEQALNSLGGVLKKRTWLRRRQNAQDIQAARARVHNALANCRAISPQHPNLQGIEDHPLLK